MPNLLDIRRRIRSVKNTQQITSAMKMVSAAKLRRAQEQALAARPYAQQLYALMGGLAGYLDPQDLADARLPGADWPLAALLDRRPVLRRLLVVISTDSGLAGAFNANALKAAHAAAAGTENQILAVGRKARDFYRRRQATLLAGHVGLFQHGVDHELARQVATEAMQAYATGAVDEVVVVGNEFKSVLQQVVVRRRLLPLQLEPPAASGTPGAASVPAAPAPGPAPATGSAAARDYIFETPPAQLLAELLPRAIITQIYRSLLESQAAEHAARMNAMEAATSNANDLIETLTLNMNRIRQAAITKEIIEVVSGAAALG